MSMSTQVAYCQSFIKLWQHCIPDETSFTGKTWRRVCGLNRQTPFVCVDSILLLELTEGFGKTEITKNGTKVANDLPFWLRVLDWSAARPCGWHIENKNAMIPAWYLLFRLLLLRLTT